MDRDAAPTLARLRPRLDQTFAAERAADPDTWGEVQARLDRHFEALFTPLRKIYGDRFDFWYHLERIVELAVRSALERPSDLRLLDEARDLRPDWFLSEQMLGAVCYVDRYAGTLAGLRERIPYFKELGLTYLHLMPLFLAPDGHNDGGYAVSSYREVDPRIGTMADLATLARDLRAEGISLVLDFIFNHTSDEHEWAIAARANPDAPDTCYLMYPDRTLPDLYDATVREIFPDQRPGAFTWLPDAERWVWTTFHSFQWDLDYANPEVFRRMGAEMLFLANQGVEILRLDAVAFVWKRPGTVCESLPEAHLIVRAFNALSRIAAPALLFKSEAIVHPAEVLSYIDPLECQLSYNPLQMAVGWEALATRDARLMRQSLRHWWRIPRGAAWVNYVRSHDDIGWTFDDDDADALGIDGFQHRRFLNAFYTGRFPGSFSRGLPFQENPKTGDARISGSCASLAGLGKALLEEGPTEVELAIRRVALLYGLGMSLGGIPLIYLGDELATLNDHRFADMPEHADDSRWVHRPAFDPAAFARRTDERSIEGRLFARISRLVALRKGAPALAGVDADFPDTGNDRVMAYWRWNGSDVLLALANVGEGDAYVAPWALQGLGERARDLIDDELIETAGGVGLAPYQLRWLVPAR